MSWAPGPTKKKKKQTSIHELKSIKAEVGTDGEEGESASAGVLGSSE